MYSKLRGIMREKNVTQEEIADELNTCQSYVSQRLTGRTKIDIGFAYKVLDILHIPHDQFSVYFPADRR